MKLFLKDNSINLNGASYEIVKAIVYAMDVWLKHGMAQITITSGLDGPHMATSLHPLGYAVDIRSHTLPDVFGMCDELRERLGPSYDVVIEHDHIHIEYDPKE